MTENSLGPLVTVVTPSYNQGRFIEETILSVLNQDYPNIEYIVIDGGSSDNTIEILRRYNKLLTWISEPDRGQSHAINKGFRMANGEILCWLNSDDTFVPGAISKVVECFVKDPGTSMVYGLVNIVSEAGELTEQPTRNDPFDLWSVVYFSQIIYQPAAFFLKEAIVETGYLDENLHWCMDWDLWVRLGMRYRLTNSNHIFSNIRMYRTTKTSTGGLRRIQEIVKVMRRYSHCSLAFGITRAGLGGLHTFLMYRLPHLYMLLKEIIIYVKNRSLNKFYDNFHGVYSDGWLGRKARFMFPMHADASAVKFSLSFRPELCTRKGRVTAIINGKRFKEFLIPPTTTYELLLPYDRNFQKPTEVELIFTRYLPPDEQCRKRACKLDELSLVASSRSAIPVGGTGIRDKTD